MKSLSRRDFLKGTIAGAAGMALTGMMVHAEEGGPGMGGEGGPGMPFGGSSYTPGVYTATGTGINGEVTATVTFDSTSITDVVLDVSVETPEIGGAAGDKLVTQILEAQSAQIDGVTGASVTSDAVRVAVAKCIAEAKGEVYVDPSAAQTDPNQVTDEEGNTIYYSMRRSWVGEAPQYDESDIAGEYSADVIIVGANYSGSCCFRYACEAGSTCIAIDSQTEEGFNSYGGQLGHFNSTWQEEVLGVPKSTFDPVDFIESYQLQSAGRAQPDLIRQFAQRNGEIVDHLMDVYDDIHEVQSVCTIDQSDNEYNYKKGQFWTYPACIQLGTGSIASSADFCKAQLARGMEASTDSQVIYGMTAKVLIKDGDTVCGVIAKAEDGKFYRFMSRKGVVLATGDFSANSAMYNALCTEVQEINPYDSLSGMGRNGSGHKMGIWAGGVMEIGPRAAMGGATSCLVDGLFGAAAGIWINKYGNRFCNEAFGVPFVAGCQSARQPIGSNITQVWDHGHWKAFAQNQALGHFNSDNISDAKMEEYEEKLAAAYAAGPEGADGVYAADDLKTLASYLGFEGEAAENFVKAVERYDGFAEAGRDEDYAKPADMMYRINEGPFYGETYARDSNRVLVTLAGLYVDGNHQVLNQKFEPIPGLFAIGNASGGRFPLQYTSPMNGISIGMATVLGAVAGEYVGGKAPVVSTGDSDTSSKGTV